MKKTLFIFTLFIASSSLLRAQLYSTNSGHINFFSYTPAENIDANSNKTLAVMNVAKREFAISVANTSFEFDNKLMKEHFNEKYIESEKFPNSTFKGKINEDVDLTKEGEYKITATGKLNIHGVEKERTINGVAIVKNGEIILKSEFAILIDDHKIEIPKLVLAKIAEEMKVKFEAKLLPKK